MHLHNYTYAMLKLKLNSYASAIRCVKLYNEKYNNLQLYLCNDKYTPVELYLQ